MTTSPVTLVTAAILPSTSSIAQTVSDLRARHLRWEIECGRQRPRHGSGAPTSRLTCNPSAVPLAASVSQSTLLPRAGAHMPIRVSARSGAGTPRHLRRRRTLWIRLRGPWDRALRRRCRAAQDRSHRRPPSAPYIITMAPSPLPPLPPNHDASGRPAMRQDHHVGALHRAEQLHAGPPDHADVVTLLPRSTSATPASGALPARLSIR
jgi:hypothetical protein